MRSLLRKFLRRLFFVTGFIKEIMSNSISRGPFLTADLHQTYPLKYLEIPDIAHASQVCKQWKLAFSYPGLWKALSKKEGIPFVREANGEVLNYQKTFQVLYPITLSGRKISQYIGRVEEEIPDISEECFNKLNELDPYEEGKLKRETWVVVVVPSYVLRTPSQDTPLALDTAGNLVKVKKHQSAAIEEKQIKIPLSLQNLKMLCLYPLKGKEKMPVFSLNSILAIFKQCGLPTHKTNVYFMRRHIVEESRGKSYVEQEQILKNHGDEVIPLKPRTLFDAISILQTGNCPDDVGVSQRTFVRHPDTIPLGNSSYRSVIGGFEPFSGVTLFGLDTCYTCNDHTFGVVPGSLAEVPSIDT
jgi:hypothetical protein